MDPFAELVTRLREHPRAGEVLFWLENISDEYLERVYAASTCLIAASEEEGFGLPLIEAAQHKLPIIARDIPVFREVAGEHSFYFVGKDAQDLAGAVHDWLELRAKNLSPPSDDLPALTWKQSAARLLDIILLEDWAYRVIPESEISLGIPLDHRSNRLAWIGFSDPEHEFRWTDGHKASVRFSWPSGLPAHAQIDLSLDSLGEQHVTLELNGFEVYKGVINGIREKLSCALRLDAGINHIDFALPNALQPDNGDKRRLAIAIRRIVFRSQNDVVRNL
jgi:hypothetical protein